MIHGAVLGDLKKHESFLTYSGMQKKRPVKLMTRQKKLRYKENKS